MLPGWALPIEVGGVFVSYAAALLLELRRSALRPDLRMIGPIGWTAVGIALHAVYLVHRAAQSAGLPLSSTQDWLLVSAWVLASVYLYLTVHHPKVSFGWILLPIILLLVTVAWLFGDVRSFPREISGQIWAWVHGLSFLLATVAVLVAFATGVMYLVQARRLRQKRISAGWRLPSLEWLQKTNARTVTIALFLLATGILSGFVLNLWNLRQNREVVPLWDPLIVITLLMFTWLAGCVGIGLVYRPAREGRKVALMTMMTALFLAVALFLFVWGETGHGQFRRPNLGSDRQGDLGHEPANQVSLPRVMDQP